MAHLAHVDTWPSTGRDDAKTARLDRAQGQSSPRTVSRSWQGIYDPNDWPTAPKSAIGPTRYVEVINDVINDGYAIYDRTHNTPLVKGPLYDLVSCGDSNCYNVSPSVIWDPTTKRFYYVAEAPPGGPGQDGHLMIGFSKTATPGAGSTWCHYQLNVGPNFPDRPQLGDSTNFMILGYNLYDGVSEHFTGARLAAFVKPSSAPIQNCPSSLQGHASDNLKDAAGHSVFAPAPANEVDGDSTGWVLARSGSLPSTSLALFEVTRGATGGPTFHITAANVPVASYQAPTDAPQQGVPYKIDTGYGGPVSPVAAIDPLHGNKDRIWVSMSVAGGAGSQVRWFEIDPVAHRAVQHGVVTSTQLWSFNGAVSSDRVNNGSAHAFGSSMVITYDTSSASTLPTVYARSKIGNGAVTSAVKIVTANGADNGADCRSGQMICQWGGGSASPDPAASTSGRTGTVWSVQMISAKGADQFEDAGMSWNFAITP